MNHSDNESPSDDSQWEGLSLEELGQAYADVVGHSDSPTSSEHADGAEPSVVQEASLPVGELTVPDAIPSLSAIIEGALFIGHADGRAVQESELAALMRDVTVDDIADEIERLNDSYKHHEQAFRILRDDNGVRLGVAADLETVRRAFYGKVREATLSQGAVEVLSLVAYQPGITGDKIQDQRGKESASLLSQLVRRRLLEQRREAQETGRRPTATYYPTERFLTLFGLESLDDLPQVEE